MLLLLEYIQLPMTWSNFYTPSLAVTWIKMISHGFLCNPFEFYYMSNNISLASQDETAGPMSAAII